MTMFERSLKNGETKERSWLCVGGYPFCCATYKGEKKNKFENIIKFI